MQDTNPPAPFPTVTMPFRAMCAVSFFSAVLGREFDASSSDFVTWASSDDPERHAFALSWQGTEVTAKFDAESDAETQAFYSMVGYCAVHGIRWEST